VALPFTLKKYLKKAKERRMETQTFHHAKNIPNLHKKKSLLKKPKSFKIL
jgi:hypothetical protein